MYADHLWTRIAYGYFICTTLSLFILLEKIVFGLPYLTIFLIIFAITLHVNRKLLS